MRSRVDRSFGALEGEIDTTRTIDRERVIGVRNNIGGRPELGVGRGVMVTWGGPTIISAVGVGVTVGIGTGAVNVGLVDDGELTSVAVPVSGVATVGSTDAVDVADKGILTETVLVGVDGTVPALDSDVGVIDTGMATGAGVSVGVAVTDGDVVGVIDWDEGTADTMIVGVIGTKVAVGDTVTTAPSKGETIPKTSPRDPSTVSRKMVNVRNPGVPQGYWQRPCVQPHAEPTS